MSLFDQHRPLLDRAVRALRARTYYAPYPEAPTAAAYDPAADAHGRAAFEARLGQRFSGLRQPDPVRWIGAEASPYTGQPLAVAYPYFAPVTLVGRAQAAFAAWRQVPPADRAGLLLAALEAMQARFFEIAYAAMHTTGQGFAMAFQANGPHAADRALEAIAAGYEELTRFPAQAIIWEKPVGKGAVQLRKEWRAVPRGVAVVVGCATFPTWNTLPGMFASLITGNPVIVKPHPGAVLPIALVVAEVQRVFAENGLPPEICQLAVDSPDFLIAKELCENPLVRLIDYTGGATFGAYVESLQNQGKIVFTEKTGVNCVVLDSCPDLDAVVQNLAMAVALYSGQMCTAPQNFFIPAAGVRVGSEVVPYAEVVVRLTAAVQVLVQNPRLAPHVLGALQNPATQSRAEALATSGRRPLLAPATVAHPQYAHARTAAPAFYEVAADEPAAFGQELFGPVSLVVKTADAAHAVALAADLARRQGALSCAAYTTDEALKARIKDEMGLTGTPVSFNLTGPFYVNQHAAFSDFHGSGGNPAGTAAFGSPDFVSRRFFWVGFREPVAA